MINPFFETWDTPFGVPPFVFRDTSWAIRKAETPLRLASESKPV